MNRETVLKVKKYLTDNSLLDDETFDSLPEKRKKGKIFTFNEHVEGMIYSLLSAQTKFSVIEKNRENINKLFFYYNTDEILSRNYEYFLNGLQDLKCGSRVRKAQMKVLHYNIELMRTIENEYGSMDTFVTSKPVKNIIQMLSSPSSKYKMKQMSTALVCEYLKNVGIDCAKPDVHMKRMLGCNRLGWSKYSNATNDEVYDAFRFLSEETGMYMADIDYFFWLYCSDGNAEICSAAPNCKNCVIKDECNNNK